MNARSLATVALKTWGVMLVVSAVASLPATLLMASASPGIDAQAGVIRTSQIASILHVVVEALLGGATVTWAGRISAAILPDTPALRLDVTAAELQPLAFALVGIVLLVRGLQDSAGAAYAVLSRPAFAETDTLSYLWAREGQALVKALVQIVAGAFLVFGRNALARGWSRLRGRSVEDDIDAG